MMNILITGAGGMLGDSLVSELRKSKHTIAPYSHKQTFEDLKPLDITNYLEVEKAIYSFHPDIILHLAALTDVDYCESHPKEAQDVNYLATKNIAKICRKENIKLLFISTGAVFPGTRKLLYMASDRRHPINEYGKSKMKAEDEVRKVPHHIIVRAGWIIGGGKSGKKFVSKILSQLDKNVETLYVVSNVVGSPTFTFDLSKELIKLINEEREGIFHIVNEGIASRLDIVQEIIAIRRKKTRINPVELGYFNEVAPRPHMEGLKSDIILPHWKKSLKKYLPLLT